MTAPLVFAHEAERRLRVAVLGTSGHAFRNYLPSFPFAPAELVALWDPDAARAAAFARQFGAPYGTDNLDDLFAGAAPEAVLIATETFDGDEPSNVALVERAFAAGCHVFTDKPLAASVATAARLIAARDRAGRVGMVGMKTMFYPAHDKVRQIVRDPAFGRPVSFTVRYPLHVPTRPGLPLDDPTVRSCLNHIWHPIGTVLATLGPVRDFRLTPAPAGGGGVAVATLESDAVGTFHFSAGQAGTSPLERFEVVGEGANVIVENAVRVASYRRGPRGVYGRTPTHLTDDAYGPLVWEPEMTLGQLYNTNNFAQGYAPSLIAFAHAALGGSPPDAGRFEDAATALAIFEAMRRGT